MMKTALITGGAKRIGAAITNLLHQHGFNVIILTIPVKLRRTN